MLVFPGCKFLQLKSYLGFVTCILQSKLHRLCFIIILCCSYTLKKRPTAKSIADSMEMLVMQVINTKTQQNKNQMKQNYKRDIKSTQKHIKSTQKLQPSHPSQTSEFPFKFHCILHKSYFWELQNYKINEIFKTGVSFEERDTEEQNGVKQTNCGIFCCHICMFLNL